MHFLTKREKILCPPHACTKVGILRIELEPDVMSQTIEHSINHIVHLDKEAAVNANMVHHSPMEGFINPPIRHYIQLFHDCCSESVLFGITSTCALILRWGDVEAVAQGELDATGIVVLFEEIVARQFYIKPMLEEILADTKREYRIGTIIPQI